MDQVGEVAAVVTSDPEATLARRRPILDLLRAAGTWLVAALAPGLIWTLCLENLAPRPANYLGLALQCGLGLVLGRSSGNRLHALALAAVAIRAHPGPALVYVATAAATALGRAWTERRSAPTTSDVPPSWAAQTAVGLKRILELAPSVRLRLVFTAIVSAMCFVVLELAARERIRSLDRAALRARIQDYSDPDGEDNPRFWRLHPGYRKTLRGLDEQLEREGRTLGHKILRDAIDRKLVDPSAELRINALGFKGDEFPAKKPAGERRIVCLGDSCTFGLASTSYSEAAERSFKAAGIGDVRVINAGVEGYSAFELALRVQEYVALDPDLVMVYVGWNTLYSNYDDPHSTIADGDIDYFVNYCFNPPKLSPWRLDLVTVWNRFRTGPLQSGPPPPEVKKRWEPMQADDSYRPRLTCRGLVELVHRLRDGGIPPSRILVTTLPGLLRTDRAPTEEALRLAHLPVWTQGNTYELALVYERYNAFVRELAQREGMTLVDLEQWQRSLESPPHEQFFDSLHMNLPYQIGLGEHLQPVFAEALAAKRP
ncbi:hypothetical protein HY251_20050 [bacterium]|nr:hypothetical protein [bacterium]